MSHIPPHREAGVAPRARTARLLVLELTLCSTDVTAPVDAVGEPWPGVVVVVAVDIQLDVADVELCHHIEECVMSVPITEDLGLLHGYGSLDETNGPLARRARRPTTHHLVINQ
ncbi:MAG: hypothetical protein VYD23_02050 [Candidatus Thermoplasmatota archaeon]|nr:hypothetical protein [Candidatus Thermoplasmatota archaeon]